MNWLPIKDYEGLYEISDTGLVKAVERTVLGRDGTKYPFKEKLKDFVLNKNGYFYVGLYKNNKEKKYLVHRLVASAFLANPLNLEQVNHKDGNKQNNNVSNLEWVTPQENCVHAVKSALRTYSHRIAEEDFIALLYRAINGESYYELSQDPAVPYQVPFLSVKLRKVAKELNLEDKLDTALILQKKQRSAKTGKSQRKNINIGMFSKQGIFIKQFSCLAEAKEYLKVKSSGPISNVLTGRQTTAYGYLWKYL